MANVSILGTARSFAVLGATTVTNTGATAIFGDVGVSPGTAITGFPPGIVTGGALHAGDPAATQAQADLAVAYNFLVGETATTILPTGDLSGLTLTPGVYQIATSAQLTGTLTLDAQGDPNASFDFQIGTTLVTASNSAVTLINGARGDNVFFQVGSSATLGANTSFAGNILANTSITLTTGASIADGRALAVNAAVTLDTNAVNIPAALFSIGDVSVNEAAGTVDFTVTLSRPSGLTTTVNASTFDASAASPADFTASSLLLTFAPGVVSQTFSVPVINDTLDEAPEAFFVDLSAPTDATLADAQAIGTILDDDPTPSLTIGDAAGTGNFVTVVEGNTGTINAVFTVRLSAPSGRVVTVNFATSDGTAIGGTDYTPTVGTLTFLPGVTAQIVSVAVLSDTMDEPDETFTVNLSNPTAATIAGARGIGTILDDDDTIDRNDSPAGVDDRFITSQDTALTGSAPGVLANDTDPEGTALTASLVSGPSSGTLTLNADGSFLYTPNPGFFGTDTFTYRATDGVNLSNLATATITVLDVTGPAVPGLVRFGFHAAPTFLVLTFNEDLDPARAGDLSNYRLTGPSGRPIRLSSAVYDAATRTVTIRPRRLLALNSRTTVAINGSTSTGLTDLSGNVIDGDGDGRPGGDASVRFGREALRALATTRAQFAQAGRFQVPTVSGDGLSLPLLTTLSSPRYLRLLSARTSR